ncbi:MAG: KTSC domain-containing protein [Nitrospinota bacterium]
MPANGSNVVSAEYGIDGSSGERTVRYTDDEGNETYRVGGSRAWRNNNSGNIICSNYANDYDAIGCDADGFAIFPHWETGVRAHEALLRKRSYINLTIEAAIKRYTDGDLLENQENYINYVTSKTGMPRTKRISEMTEKEYQNFLRAMREFEDSTPGKEILQFDSEGDVSYFERDYIKLGDDSSHDFANYGPDIPVRYHGYIDFTPEGFKTNRRIPVVSSNVASIGYDENSYTLEVAFHSGGIYQYFDVSPQVFEQFINADSKGKFFHEEIKGIYQYSSVN